MIQGGTHQPNISHMGFWVHDLHKITGLMSYKYVKKRENSAKNKKKCHKIARMSRNRSGNSSLFLQYFEINIVKTNLNFLTDFHPYNSSKQ